MVRLLRRSGRPVVVAVNKVDDMRTEPNASDFWSLGFGEPVGISAMHGRGVGDLLDRAIQAASEAPARPAPPKGLRRVALVGRPNVGKSSLLNKLAGADRVIVDSVAGTTRDPVDEVIDLDGRQWLFVDTAGIRRKVRQAEGTEFFAALRTQAALERAEVAVVVVDGSAPLAEQDVRVVANAVAAGRALVLAVNKWDLVDDERRHYLDREIERDLGHVAWAPRVNIAALTGWHVNRLTSALDEALTSWDTRVPTGRLNGLVAEITAAHPHPVRGGRQPRILYATQPATRPPRFVLFATGFIEAGYRRFIERRLRETFGFQGTPIQVSVRVRTKRTR
jgi:GTP-binding protein